MTRGILAIDGGGTRGVLPVAFLASIEEGSGRRVLDHFDLIARTSTGGAIALGLGLGLSARTILDFYLDDGPRIFDQESRPDHSVMKRLVLRARRVSGGSAKS
jgi:patatin-like phospholipase/acyl hydrolase